MTSRQFNESQQVLSVDIMKDGGRRYYKTLKYRFTPPIDLEAFYVYIVNMLPSLTGKEFTFVFDDIVDGKKHQVWGEFRKNKSPRG